MQTDAVMNGVILDKEGHYEISLQVISSKDSRLIWWQAVDVSFREGALLRSEQQKVLSSLLSPFLALSGQKEQQQQLKQDHCLFRSLSQTGEPSGMKTPCDETARN
jgi:hypothetical protein